MATANYVRFLRGTPTAYTNLSLKDSDTLYFISEKNGEKEYFQVCYLLTNQDVVEREYRPLQQINDNFPKTILSMDELPASNTDGILRLNLRQWLLKT